MRGCRQAWAAVYSRAREKSKGACIGDRLESARAWGTIPDEPGHGTAPDAGGRTSREGSLKDRAWNIGLLLLRFTGLYLAFGHGHMKIVSLMHGEAGGFVGAVGAMGLPNPMLFAWLAACAEF